MSLISSEQVLMRRMSLSEHVLMSLVVRMYNVMLVAEQTNEVYFGRGCGRYRCYLRRVVIAQITSVST